MAAIGQGAGGEAATQGGGDAGQQQQQGGADLSSLTGALEGLSQGQQELRDFLQSNPWQQQAEPESQQQQAPPEVDLSFIDTGDPALDQQLAQQMAGVFQQTMQQREQALMQRVEERFGQVDERLSERERVEHTQALINEFQELGDPQVYQEVAGVGNQYAEACGWPQEVAADPRFHRLVYMAGRAAESANGEQQEGQQEQGPGGSGAAHLEGGGGANPGAGGQVDAGDAWVQRVQSDGLGHRALPWH